MSITKEKMLDVYATMQKIRMFEDRVAELFAAIVLFERSLTPLTVTV